MDEMDDLQRLVDLVGQRLGRSVAIDDPAMRLLFYSAHVDTADPVRTEAVLSRRAPSEAAAWVRAQGVSKTARPMRVAGNPSLGLLPRICIPLRVHGKLLGYMWLIDADGSLSDHEMELAERAGAEASELLFRERVAREGEHEREIGLVKDLLLGDAQLQRVAARTIVENQLLLTRGGVAVVSLRARDALRDDLDPGRSAALAGALESARAHVATREALWWASIEEGALVISATALSETPELPGDLHRDAEGALGRSTLVVGVGDVRQSLTEASASYGHATAAAHVARCVPDFSPVGRWGQLGAYGLLASIGEAELSRVRLSHAFEVLAGSEPELLATVETFLDHAGDTSVVAKKLFVHRATVYARMKRVEELTGVDLDSGDARLALHLSIRMARLTGRI
jgi:DNA-binding PucR family transcriptional regulator